MKTKWKPYRGGTASRSHAEIITEGDGSSGVYAKIEVQDSLEGPTAVEIAKFIVKKIHKMGGRVRLGNYGRGSYE